MSAKAAYQYNLAHWSDIQEHLPLLYESAKGDCVEIGVRSGISTSALLAGLEDHGGHLWSYDINDCPVFSGHPQWTFLRWNTQLGIPLTLPNILDLAFIDGDHTYEGARSDLMRFGTIAKLVLVHDTDCPDTFPGVRKAVEEFVRETGRKITWHHGSYGMAEIR